MARSWWPGPGGPVPVARYWWPGTGGPARSWPGPGGPAQSQWPAPVFAVARWPGPGPGPGPGPCCLSCPWSGFGGPVARSRSRSRPGPGPGPSPCPCPATGSQPASMSPGMDAQSLPLFYAVLQIIGERQTISRNHYRTKTGAKRLPKPTA